jgi:hypothetical protein
LGEEGRKEGCEGNPEKGPAQTHAAAGIAQEKEKPYDNNEGDIAERQKEPRRGEEFVKVKAEQGQKAGKSKGENQAESGGKKA